MRSLGLAGDILLAWCCWHKTISEGPPTSTKGGCKSGALPPPTTNWQEMPALLRPHPPPQGQTHCQLQLRGLVRQRPLAQLLCLPPGLDPELALALLSGMLPLLCLPACPPPPALT